MPKHRVRTINLAPAINKSLDTSDIRESNVLESEVDKQTDIIQPPNGLIVEGLKVLRNCSIWHRKALKAVAQDVTKNGWKPVSLKDNANEDNKTLIEDIFNDYDNSQALFKAIHDYRTYPHAAFEILTNTEGELRGFNHIRATTIRMCKGGEKAVQRVGAETRYFKVYGKVKKSHKDMDLHETGGTWGVAGVDFPEEETATYVVWLTEGGEDSDYYHEPEYLPSVPTIISDEALREYNLNGLRTNGVPNFLILFAGEFEDEGVDDDDEESKPFDEDLEDAFANVPNEPGTAIVFPIKTTGKDAGMIIDVHKLSESLQEGSYSELSERNMNEILAAHEVPPQRLGITITGPLGGSDAEERNKLYNEKVVSPLQLMLDNILNKLISELLDIDDWKHQFTQLNTRNVKAELEIALELVKNAAMKPSQLLAAFGEMFKLDTDIEQIVLDYPELDEYYMNGQPLKQGSQLPAEVQGIMKMFNEKSLEIAKA